MYFNKNNSLMKPITASFLALVLAGLSYSCQSSRTGTGLQDKKANTAKNYPLNVSFSADYVIVNPTQRVALWGADSFSQPRGGRMSTVGDGYFLTLKGNSINAELPYYGQRDLFRDPYESPDIILKDGALENIKYGRTADRKILALEFDVLRNTERFHVQLIIMSDRSAYLQVNSPQRQSIRYEGTVASL